MKFLHGVSLRRSFAVGVAALFMGLLLYRPGETEEVKHGADGGIVEDFAAFEGVGLMRGADS